MWRSQTAQVPRTLLVGIVAERGLRFAADDRASRTTSSRLIHETQ
jgi:hypothetical protein